MAAHEHVARVGQEFNAVQDVGDRDRHDLNAGIACANSNLEGHTRNNAAGPSRKPYIDKRARRQGSVGRRSARKERPVRSDGA